MTSKYWDLRSGRLIDSIKSSDMATSSIKSPCGNYELLGMEDSTTIFKDYSKNISFKFIMKDDLSKSLSATRISRDGQ